MSKTTNQTNQNKTVINETVQNPETQIEAVPEETTPVVNAFEFGSAAAVTTDSKTRRLDYTPVLIDTSNRRAQDLMLQQHVTRPELTPAVQKVLRDLNPNDLADLLCNYFGTTIQSDSMILDGCDDDQLDKLLESRRSDRSKAKAKFASKKQMSDCKTYISAMYAELLIRTMTGKPYTGASSGQLNDLNESDLDAVDRRIKSLQSKKCRLKPLAEYNQQAKVELAEVNAEIDRLNSLKPNTRATTKVAVKDLSIDQIRAALDTIDPSELNEDDAVKFFELIKKLG